MLIFCIVILLCISLPLGKGIKIKQIVITYRNLFKFYICLKDTLRNVVNAFSHDSMIFRTLVTRVAMLFAACLNLNAKCAPDAH